MKPAFSWTLGRETARQTWRLQRTDRLAGSGRDIRDPGMGMHAIARLFSKLRRQMGRAASPQADAAWGHSRCGQQERTSYSRSTWYSPCNTMKTPTPHSTSTPRETSEGLSIRSLLILPSQHQSDAWHRGWGLWASFLAIPNCSSFSKT